ncbi:MAG TPA: SIMPL domain-containing protein [Bryobacteraceae bacterium]|nr:SIMPL domain-containing protein [Bryobacteraceae bacterium]
MPLRAILFVFLLSTSLAFAQLDSNSVTVTASRTVVLQPDEVIFAVYVGAPLSATLDDVVSALSGSGITAANFAGLTTPQFSFVPSQPQTTLQWAFALTAPFAKMKDTISTLNALQKSIGQNDSGLTLQFQIQGAQVSQQLAQMQNCPQADLIADARNQAAKLAAAAGLSIGNILAISAGTSSTVGNVLPAISLSSFISGSTLNLSPGCSVIVKFALQGN